MTPSVFRVHQQNRTASPAGVDQAGDVSRETDTRAPPSLPRSRLTRNHPQPRRRSFRMNSAARSAIIKVGELVLPDVMLGITEASAMRSPRR